MFKEFRNYYGLTKKQMYLIIMFQTLFLISVNMGLPFRCRTVRYSLFYTNVIY